MDDSADILRPGHGIAVPVTEVEWRFTASGGPGGQHANRSNTRVEAVLDLTTASGVPDDVRGRLVAGCGPTLTVVVDDTRSQHRNRQIALERLTERMQRALVTKKRRRATRPSKGAKQRRIDEKKRRSQTKRDRGRVSRDD